jgi:BirA family biotin operon repressor/biotin-[acetyl-CoA-carboxylase] ligase
MLARRAHAHLAVLRQLDGREFRSADALAATVATTPAAVAALLAQAQDAGAPVVFAPGRGYRLASEPDWLDAACIQRAVAASGLQVQVLDSCDSTNSALMRSARSGAASGQVLVAEWQTQGRGRMGRRWHAGLGTSLTFSVLWRFGQPAAALSGLSLATGVAAVRALRRYGIEATLKWPNDLLWQERKLGGILIEVHGEPAGPCAAVIGVGLNVQLEPGQREAIGQPAADLHEAGGAARSRSEWLACLLVELAGVLPCFAQSGFASFQAEWDRYHAYAGRSVELTLPDGMRIHGIAAGIDALGRLLLAADGGVQPVTAGDVTLRTSA